MLYFTYKNVSVSLIRFTKLIDNPYVISRVYLQSIAISHFKKRVIWKLVITYFGFCVILAAMWFICTIITVLVPVTNSTFRPALSEIAFENIRAIAAEWYVGMIYAFTSVFIAVIWIGKITNNRIGFILTTHNQSMIHYSVF